MNKFFQPDSTVKTIICKKCGKEYTYAPTKGGRKYCLDCSNSNVEIEVNLSARTFKVIECKRFGKLEVLNNVVGLIMASKENIVTYKRKRKDNR